jgi:hypothetical protein
MAKTSRGFAKAFFLLSPNSAFYSARTGNKVREKLFRRLFPDTLQPGYLVDSSGSSGKL